MNAPVKTATLLTCIGLMHQLVLGSSTLPLSTPQHFNVSAAVFRGTVVGLVSYKDETGQFHTKVSLRVDESLKGKLPPIVLVTHRGGRIGNEGEVCGLSPQINAGHEYLAFVSQGPDGRLSWTQGAVSAVQLNHSPEPQAYDERSTTLLKEVRALAAQNVGSGKDVTDQVGTVITDATTGMLGNVNCRFLQPDRGEAIPVLIDATTLPAGMTLSQATNAVVQALNAWSAVTSLKFNIEGIGPFAQGADTIAAGDEKLRIQLHDNFNRINTVNVLGIGGRAYVTSAIASGWDLGGNVAGNEFAKTSYGYVVLEAGSASMQNVATFAEVLCHEIGHALNMAHSSENPSEPNSVLQQAIMYYQAHGDGRGATLGSYDPPIIRQCYPSNTVPYTCNRVIDATTAPATPDVSGINEVALRGYDLQTASLTTTTFGATALNGSFSVVGDLVKYTPAGYFLDSDRYDPDTTGAYSYRDRIFARFSDGTNASPYSMVRVISLRGEGTLTPDGIPDYWMQNFFGHTGPQAGDLSRSTDDADSDRLTNLQEYIAGMNPKSSALQQKIISIAPGTLSFQAKAYELYEILGSTNLSTWTVVKPFMPTNASVFVRTNLPQTNIIATVSNLPNLSPYMFFRVRKVP